MKGCKSYRRFVKIAAAGVTAAAVLLSASVPVSAAKKAKKQAFDPKGTYHATLGIQTCNTLWITRMGYYAKEQNEVYGTKNADKIFYKDGNKIVTQPGTLNDVEIQGNGTYTVSLDGADFGGEKSVSQLHVATDIPLNETVKFTNVSAEINGKEIASFDEAFMENETNYLGGGMVVLVLNHWREELVKKLSENGRPETAESGYDLLNGSGEENVSITFTVTGFDYDNEMTQSADTGSGEDAESQDVSDTQDAGGTDQAAGAESTAADENTPAVAMTVVILAIVAVAAIAVCFVLGKRRKKS